MWKVYNITMCFKKAENELKALTQRKTTKWKMPTYQSDSRHLIWLIKGRMRRTEVTHYTKPLLFHLTHSPLAVDTITSNCYSYYKI